MNPTHVIDLGRELLLLALVVSIPMLAAALVVGLVLSVLQAITAVHEQTLSSIPKMIAVLAIALLAMPWALGRVVTYAQRLFHELPVYARDR